MALYVDDPRSKAGKQIQYFSADIGREDFIKNPFLILIPTVEAVHINGLALRYVGCLRDV